MYVACLGRGATGFTTRSGIGPARAASYLTDRSAAAAVPAAGRGRGKEHGEDDGGDEEKGYDENRGQRRRALLQLRLRRGYNDSVAVSVRECPENEDVWLVQMRQRLSLRGV